MNLRLLVLPVVFLFAGFGVYAQESNSVFLANRGKDRKWISYQNNNQALYKIICNEAFQLLEERTKRIEQLETKEDWQLYRENLRSKLYASMDKFEKTPLYPKTTGIIKKETYTVEKILFESHPGFYVTGCLFIPKKRQKPAPCVIYVCGHTDLGFRSDTYQRVILNLVEKGFVVFGMDPIGQGERLQYLDPETGKSKIGGSTKEHTYAGVQTLITGTSLTDYFIWDGVRAIDFLETRKEVDPGRIGITGRSGGGTQSAIIAAYDERIYASAPECYITNFTRLLQSIGPQDAEQNPFNAIKLGFDHPDFMHLRAPKPTLIVTTTHDFFSQQGARETFKEAQKSYGAFNAPGNIQMVEDMGGHESTKNNREAVYAFFRKHLKNEGDITDLDVELFAPEELWVTPTGQLQSSIKGKTVFDLNQHYFSKKPTHKTNLKDKAEELSGVNYNRKLTAAVYTGKIENDDLMVEKYFIENSLKDFALPVTVITSKTAATDKLLVWLHVNGKKEITQNAYVQHYLNEGYSIISADLPGSGELYDPGFSGDGFVHNVPFNYTFGAHLVGKSIPGIHAESIDLLMQFVAQINAANLKTDILTEGEINSSVLHYTASNNPFSQLVFLNPVESALDLISNNYYTTHFAYHIVPGSLPFYDFNDLKALIPFYKIKTFKTGSEASNTAVYSDILEVLKKSR